MSVREKTAEELRAKRAYKGEDNEIKFWHNVLTWVAMYAIDAGVTKVIPWIRALPDRVALGILSTELGEVNMYLYALGDAHISVDKYHGDCS